ncbi:uncharacterized protein CTRU02_207554 [Colletotrichum truncatum]|uniref:Uncharacterized protein n=1 Tax=Colletotrichum truncatum TaxID=5467 RepID=A0ACC3Z162_COLTU|nr:uncharacterized protein CTRU02_00816 [Colletotrichum truncatum]KAF6800411.1 hypothetical protein CTRU02_00816 [Colletotrichum truncatum]
MTQIPPTPLLVASVPPAHSTYEYITRLMNSALQERHVDPTWRYNGHIVRNDAFIWVTFATETRHRTAWPRDYRFRSCQPRCNPTEPSYSIHADLAQLARRCGANINELHSFMCFPPVRAVVRTLLIELENPEAQNGQRPVEADIINSVNETIASTVSSERQKYVTQITPAGPDFSNRALVLCLVKLFAHFESWGYWRFGPGGRRLILETLISIVGLFCNAWAHAPMIDVAWSRLGKSVRPTSPFVEQLNNDQPSPSGVLMPEIWLEWSLMFDPWIRRGDSIQLLRPDNPEPPVFLAEVSEPEADNEGRVVVKYLSKPDEERWSFKSILDSKWTGKRPRSGLQYLVDWEYAEPSWQPAKDLQGCESWVLQFHRLHPHKAGPVSKLSRFL